MSDTTDFVPPETAPPTPGQDPWGDHMNAYLQYQESRTYNLEVRMATVENKLDSMTQSTPVYFSGSWQYSDQPLPPTGNQVRMDDPDPQLVTSIVFRKLDNNGNDQSDMLRRLKRNDVVKLSDWDNADVFYRYRVLSAAVPSDDDVQVPVSWHSSNGTIPNAKAEAEFLIYFQV